MLFSTYIIASKHFDLIAVSVELPLLLRVLRGAGANDAETLEVKLTEKEVAAVVGSGTDMRPFLSFTARVGGACGQRAYT